MGSWNLDEATYEKSKDFSGDLSGEQINDVAFKSDGTKLFLIDSNDYLGQTERIRSYTLSTAWDISTASLQNTYSVSWSGSAGTSFAEVLEVKDSGSRLYMVIGSTAYVVQYDLTSSWDLTTISETSNEYELGSTYGASDLTMKSDGTKMVIPEWNNDDDFDEYNINTAWDISTAGINQTQSITEDDFMYGIEIGDSGSKMISMGSSNDKLYEYNLSTPWSVTSESLVQSFDISGQTTSGYCVTVASGGNKVYIAGGKSIYQYNLSPGIKVLTTDDGSLIATADGDVTKAK